MRLRPERPPVTRLSRKVLVGLGVWSRRSRSPARCSSLCSRSAQTAGSELYNTDNRTTPDGLANLPRDYTGLPQTTHRSSARRCPAISAGRSSTPARRPGMPTPAAPDPEQQRIAQEQEAARISRLFATTNYRQVAAAAAPKAPPAPSGRRLPAVAGVERSRLAGSQARLSRTARVDRRTVSPDRVAGAREPLCAAGRRRHPRRADHRDALRPAGPGHRPGDRGRL